MDINLLASEIRSRFKTNSVFLRGDERVQWGQVANVMSVLREFDLKAVTRPEELPK